MLHVQRRVVHRQIRVARVAEDAFNEVQVAHQIARHEEANLHRLLRAETRHGGAHERPQQQRDEAFCRLRLRRGEGQAQQRLRWLQSGLKHLRERALRHSLLIVRNRQATLGDVEDAGGGALVLGRVVQHALPHAIRADDVGMELVPVRRQRQRTRDAVAVEHEGLVRQPHGDARLVQILVEELLDAPVHRGLVICEQPLRLAMPREQRLSEVAELRRVRRGVGGAAQRGELQVDVGDELGVGQRQSVASESDGSL